MHACVQPLPHNCIQLGIAPCCLVSNLEHISFVLYMGSCTAELLSFPKSALTSHVPEAVLELCCCAVQHLFLGSGQAGRNDNSSGIQAFAGQVMLHTQNNAQAHAGLQRMHVAKNKICPHFGHPALKRTLHIHLLRT